MDRVQFADPSVANHFCKLVITWQRTIFQADGKDTSGFFHRIDQFTPFVDGKGRFLADHIFPGFQSHDRHRNMPMVGRGNANRIDILPSEQVAKIVRDRAVLIPIVLVHRVPRGLSLFGFDVAHRNCPAIVLLKKCFQIAAESLKPHTDESHRGLI